MPKATIVVQYINEPKGGRKNGSIKDADGNMWLVPKEELGDYDKGGQYEITYEQFSFKGQDYCSIKEKKKVGGEPVGGVGGHGDPQQAERIFVCGAINSTLSNPQVNPLEIGAVRAVQLVNIWRDVYKRTFGGEATIQDDMNDEIPEAFK